MWLQRYTVYLLRHRWQALALTFGVTFIPVVGILGILIAALVTLVKGIAEGAIFTLAASLPFLLSFLVSETRGETSPLVVGAAMGVAIVSNLLTWVFAVMLNKKSTWATILQMAALLGVLVISVIHLAYPDVADWWGAQLQSYYNRAALVAEILDNKEGPAKGVPAAVTTGKVQSKDVQSPNVQTPNVQTPNVQMNNTERDGAPDQNQNQIDQNQRQLESINVTKQYATGMMVTVVLFNAIMQLIVARWWQGLVFKPATLRKELHSIRLSQLAGVLFLMAMVLWYYGNRVIVDIMPVVYLLFGGAGLSLIHYLFGLIQSPTSWFWLVLLYVILVFALPASIFLLALIALLDGWFDLRKRIHKA